jgi:predicted phage terminase large subunit-like protein
MIVPRPPTRAELEAELRRRDRESAQAELARRHLADFFRMFWPIIEPGTPLHWNWHVDEIGDHLEAVARGEVRSLLIEMPPRMLKSRAVSVMFPAWVWATRPSYRALFGSYSSSVSEEASVYCRQIIESPLYQRHFARPAGWELLHDRNLVDEFFNTQGGHRMATSVTGKSTGKGGDLVVADDPISADDVYSEAKRDHASRWWLKAMASRLNDQRTGCRVMVMQRLHTQDPAARWLETGTVQVRLNLPMRYSQRRVYSFGLLAPTRDPRTQDGELLDPVRFPQKEVDVLARQLGPDASAQLDQAPLVEGGGFFKARDWRFFRIDGERWDAVRPDGCAPADESPTLVVPVDYNQRRVLWETEIISLDANFRGNLAKGNDPAAFVVVVVHPLWPARRFVLDCLIVGEGFKETKDAMRALAARYPGAFAKLVEGKANGDAIVDDLRGEVSGLVVIEPEGGKEARAARSRVFVMSGDVYLPEGAPWVTDFVIEHSAFPKGDHDDRVDALSQALNWLAGPGALLSQLEAAYGT